LSDELGRVEASVTAARCAQCDDSLPTPAETFSIVRGSEGEMLSMCSVSCLAAIVTTPPTEGRRN
jgi:hypothetical protein